ncbi:hypothetical protein HOY82DRAFT_544399 [Tuber indicum]|nr:hypothetical protein HOY82DRAFT_544399 [Tuber indicum]
MLTMPVLTEARPLCVKRRRCCSLYGNHSYAKPPIIHRKVTEYLPTHTQPHTGTSANRISRGGNAKPNTPTCDHAYSPYRISRAEDGPPSVVERFPIPRVNGGEGPHRIKENHYSCAPGNHHLPAARHPEQQQQQNKYLSFYQPHKYRSLTDIKQWQRDTREDSNTTEVVQFGSSGQRPEKHQKKPALALACMGPVFPALV